jgi:hypothetical protein
MVSFDNENNKIIIEIYCETEEPKQEWHDIYAALLGLVGSTSQVEANPDIYTVTQFLKQMLPDIV